jgi:hypothetical protein
MIGVRLDLILIENDISQWLTEIPVDASMLVGSVHLSLIAYNKKLGGV